MVVEVVVVVPVVAVVRGGSEKVSRILLEILSSAVSGCLVVKCRNDSSESLERDFHVFFWMFIILGGI